MENLLIDTNIFVELLLQQNRAAEVRTFFAQMDLAALNVTDFSIHSVGVILLRQKRGDLIERFVNDMIPLNVITLDWRRLAQIAATAAAHRLDFDDAYQSLAAELFDLQVVSFDADFDRTPRGRKTPAQILADLPPA